MWCKCDTSQTSQPRSHRVDSPFALCVFSLFSPSFSSPTPTSLPPAPIHLISTPPSLFDSSVNREENTHFLVSRRRRSPASLTAFPSISGNPLLSVDTCCTPHTHSHTQMHTSLCIYSTFTKAHNHEHIQICIPMDVVHCTYSNSFGVKSFNLIWISAQFVLSNDFTLHVLRRESI